MALQSCNIRWSWRGLDLWRGLVSGPEGQYLWPLKGGVQERQGGTVPTWPVDRAPTYPC